MNYATDAWAYMLTIGNYGSYAAMDTTDDALYSLNLGMRAVAKDIGFMVAHKFILDDTTFEYMMPHTFMPSFQELDKAEQGMHVYQKAENGVYYYGVDHVASAGLAQGDGSYVRVRGWNYEDTVLHIVPPKVAGDTIMVKGLGRITPVDSYDDALSPIPEDIRPAVCWYAVFVLALGESNYDLATACLREFDRYKDIGQALLQSQQQP